MSPFRLAFGGLVGPLLAVHVAFAAGYPVAVVQSGSDQVGQELASVLAADVSEAHDLRLVSTNAKTPHIAIMLATVDEDALSKGLSSAVSYALIGEPASIYFTSGVISCGSSEISGCAKMILGDLETMIHS